MLLILFTLCHNEIRFDPQETGELYGDPFEVSTIRREDYQLNKDKGGFVDVLQCNNIPSTRTPRGHQFPGAFLNWVSSQLDCYFRE